MRVLIYSICVTIVTEYDKMERPTRLVDPDLGETTYAYNGFGWRRTQLPTV